jgi:RimJ/RimL family protein N-acetyltransferase
VLETARLRLRAWMGISREVFYDERKVAILPMAFCFPGSGRSGDLPPRPECAPAWRTRLMESLQALELTLVIGQYAQAYHLGDAGTSDTQCVRQWRTPGPRTVPHPPPSPRNNPWLRKNPWFEADPLPARRARVARAPATNPYRPRPAVLETARLRLRELTLDDAPFMLELVNDPSWLRFIGDRGVRTLDQARKYLESGPIRSYQRVGFGTYCVELKATGEALGVCGLIRRDDLADVDVGFAFLPRHWGCGYARESTQAVLEQGRKDFGFKRVAAMATPDNEKSIRLLESLGFERQGRIKMPGETTELELYGLDFSGDPRS